MKYCNFIFILFLCIFSSCYGNFSEVSDLKKENSEQKFISIANWNVQTFFDAETSGNEYEDFIKNPKWNSESYIQRLDRLCESICTLNCDIYVFEEIENESVIQDISNRLQSNSWNCKKALKYSCFLKDENSAIGIAIISRYPIYGTKAHSMDIRCQNISQPSVRYILEADVYIEEKKLSIIANHWKSKSGSEYLTEIWRDWQENVLCNILQKYSKNDCVLLCGDFNRSAEDFYCNFSSGVKDNIFLRGINLEDSENLLCGVYSPWFLPGGDFSTEKGSYYYDKSWERIDNIFGMGPIYFTAFGVKDDSPFTNNDGTPNRYSIYNGKGISDHLPIVSYIKIK